MLSFVVPAHNESQLIAGTVRRLREAGDHAAVPYEVVVVDDASSDDTADLAARAGARVVAASVRQIAAARNAGARAARGEWLMFVDADTWVSGSTVLAALDAMSAGAAGGGARVRFDGPVPFYVRPGVAATFGAFRLLNWTVGCFMFCRRDAFDRIGGFDERLFAAEEVAFSRGIKRVGRLALVEPAVVTSARKFRTHSLREWLRMGFGALHLARAVRSRQRLSLWYGERRHDPGPPGS
jgi:glycosyltransferase involved in cell wall biosynthesis